MPFGSTSRVGLVESECGNIGGNSVPFKTSVFKYRGVISIGRCLCGSTLQRMSRIFPGVPTSRINQTAFLPECYCKTCRGNDHFSPWLFGLHRLTSRPGRSVTANPEQRGTACYEKNKKKRNHVTPLLKEHHWLPVKFRCQYKIATPAYQNFEGSLPLYLSSFLCTYQPSRSLRSSKEKLLKIPQRNLKLSGNVLLVS